MAIVLIVDQAASSTSPDRIDGAMATFNEAFGASLSLSFVRTAGDEMQAVLGDPRQLAPLLNHALDQDGWWIGIGLGEISRKGKTARSSAGSAFNYAREGVEAAKHDRRIAGPIAVRGPAPLDVRQLQAAVSGFAFIVAGRTERQREIVGAVQRAGSRRDVIERLGVSHQTIAKTLAAAGFIPASQLGTLIGDLAARAL